MAVPAPLLRPHVAYLGALALILALLLRHGWDAVWLAYGIHPLQPAFADLRTIQAGLESLRQGLDPQLVNPADPWHRPMNYPSVWLQVARLLHWENERSYLIFAGLSVAAFLACCADLIRRWPSWWAVALALSQAPALMAERANNDCVIFALVYLSAVSARPLFALLVPLATLLKLYPVLALPAFAAQRRPLLLAAGLCAAALLSLAPELGAIRSATPVSPTVSFGLPVYALALAGAGLALPPLAVGALLVLLAGLAAPALRRLPMPEAEPSALRLFLCGAALFLGSSLLGANWDYPADDPAVDRRAAPAQPCRCTLGPDAGLLQPAAAGGTPGPWRAASQPCRQGGAVRPACPPCMAGRAAPMAARRPAGG